MEKFIFCVVRVMWHTQDPHKILKVSACCKAFHLWCLQGWILATPLESEYQHFEQKNSIMDSIHKTQYLLTITVTYWIDLNTTAIARGIILIKTKSKCTFNVKMITFHTFYLSILRNTIDFNKSIFFLVWSIYKIKKINTSYHLLMQYHSFE